MPNTNARADGNPAVYGDRNANVIDNDFLITSNFKKITESMAAWDKELTGQQASDTYTNSTVQLGAIDRDTPIRIGKVLLAYPYIHCYKIQISGRQGTMVATALSRGSHAPIGVKVSDTIPPNSNILVWAPKGSNIAYILSVIPAASIFDASNASDVIQAGGNSGVKKIEAYRNVPKTAALGHSWTSQSCGRPMDGVNGEYVRMSETGIGLLIDSFQTYLRVNETCGLWLNYFDSYAKLAALSLHITSYCEHVFQQNDEGELFSIKGYATYPWEAAGMYATGESNIQINDEFRVQSDKKFPFASADLKDFSQVPVYRMTDYTGYLGQGFNRTLVRPAKENGPRLMTDAANEPDTGLCQQLMALDGSYSVKSAKQITFAKYPLIPNPRRVRQVEDALGDDLTKDNNYKFSGQFGSGPDHKVLDWQDDAVTELPNLVRPAGILDLLTHHFNWKSTHPFQYHTKDYVYPEEGDTSSQLNRVMFHRGYMAESYVTLNPVKLKIDDRYQDVNYYNTASIISLAEDGSVVIADGYGSQILLGGGQIRLEAGGDVMLMSGARVVTLAQESITRTKGSIDISSSEKDVRIKAEGNMQLLAGNGGTGGMLLESKGVGITQDYTNKIGEAVRAAGIVLLSKGGSIDTMAKAIYMKTGLDKESISSPGGGFVIDCADGNDSFDCYASTQSFFNSNGLGIWHSPKGRNPVIEKSHFFGPTLSVVHGPCVVDDELVVLKNLAIKQSAYALQGIYAVGFMACNQGFRGLGDSSQNGFPSQVANFIEPYEKIPKEIKDLGNQLIDAYPGNVWATNRPGNSNLLENEIGFSFRDDSDKTGKAYSYQADKFFMLEPRWQQLTRMGLVDGTGETWKENAVAYQGLQLYPWPGKVNWVDNPTLLGYSNSDQFFLFGEDKARPRAENQSSYEEPIFEDWKKLTGNEDYTL